MSGLAYIVTLSLVILASLALVVVIRRRWEITRLAEMPPRTTSGGMADPEKRQTLSGDDRPDTSAFAGCDVESSPGARSTAQSTETVVEAQFTCDVCGEKAGAITLLQTEERFRLRRRSFTGSLDLRITAGIERIRAAIERRDAGELFEFDRELAPFYCPSCFASFCGAHWTWWDVFDDEHPDIRDSIRGFCPARHERMLED